LEINPSHPAIKELFERVKEDPDRETEELAKVLYEGALINSGYTVKDPDAFSKRFYKLFNGALGIPRDAKVEEIEVDLDDDDDEEEIKEKQGKKPHKKSDSDSDDLDHPEPVKAHAEKSKDSKEDL